MGADLEDIEDINTSVLDLADLEEAVRVACCGLILYTCCSVTAPQPRRTSILWQALRAAVRGGR